MNLAELQKHRGKFFITWELLQDITLEQYGAILKDVVIVKAEYDFLSHSFVYVGMSPHFDEVPEGSEPPVYMLDRGEDGCLHWQRRFVENPLDNSDP